MRIRTMWRNKGRRRGLLFFILWDILGAFLASTSVYAECNGHKARWCQDHYWHERNGISNLLPQLRNRLAGIPGEIQATVNQRAILQERLSGVRSQIPWSERMIQRLQAEKSNLIKINESAAQSVQAFETLSESIRGQLPMLVERIRSDLLRRETLIADRILEIDQELSSATDPSQIQALSFEKDRLVEIQAFRGKFATTEEAREAIQAVFQGRATLPEGTLSPEAMALVAEAISATQSYVSAEKLRLSLKERMEEVGRVTERRVLELDEELARERAGWASLQETSWSIEVEIRTQDARIQNLNEQLSRILPAAIQEKERRLAVSDIYWHCCDNEWFCHHLPDWWEQTEQRYRDYEVQISPLHHEAYCRKGDDL